MGREDWLVAAGGLALIVLAGGTGCATPELRVTFDIPELYRADVESVVIHVLEPSEESPFDCDDLAFGEVAEETLRARELPATILENGKPAALPEITREGTKLIWAEGLDRDGLLVVADCEEVGEILDTQTVPLEGEVAPVVFVESEIPDSLKLGLHWVNISLLDAHNRPLTGLTVRVTVVGPQGEIRTISFENDKSAYDYKPAPLSHSGPAMLRIRARWQRNPSRMIPAAMGERVRWPAVSTEGFPVHGRGMAFGLVQRGSEVGPRLVVTAEDDARPGDTTVSQFRFDATGERFAFVPAAESIVDGIAGAMAVVVDIGTERLFVANENNLHLIPAAPGPPVSYPLTAPAGAGELLALVPIKTCDPAQAEHELIAKFRADVGPEAIGRVYASDGSTSPDSPFQPEAGAAFGSNTEILASGCLTAPGQGDLPALAFDRVPAGEGVGDALQLATVQVAGQTGLVEGELRLQARTLGFIPSLAGSSHQLFGLVLEPHRTILGRYEIISSTEQEVDLQLAAEDSLGAPPDTIATGDVDNDGLMDIVLLTRLGGGAPQQNAPYAIVIILGVEYENQRVVGTLTTMGLTSPRMRVADFDGDGFADIAIADFAPSPGLGTVFLRVLGMGAISGT